VKFQFRSILLLFVKGFLIVAFVLQILLGL